MLIPSPQASEMSSVDLPVRSCGFRFLELPFELRLCVYHAMLEDLQGEVRIRGHQAVGDPSGDVVVRLSAHSQTLSQYCKLLRVSQQIFDEAAGALYGSSNLVFDHAWCLQSFLENAHSQVRHLRFIEIMVANGTAATTDALRLTARLMAEASHLTRFSVDATNRDMCPRLRGSVLLDALTPITKSRCIKEVRLERNTARHDIYRDCPILNMHLVYGVARPSTRWQFQITFAPPVTS